MIGRTLAIPIYKALLCFVIRCIFSLNIVRLSRVIGRDDCQPFHGKRTADECVLYSNVCVVLCVDIDIIHGIGVGIVTHFLQCLDDPLPLEVHSAPHTPHTYTVYTYCTTVFLCM